MDRREDFDASGGRSWSLSEEDDTFLQRDENAAIERNRFGFRARSMSDAMSPPSDHERFAGFHHTHDGSDDHGHSGEDEEEEEEDDDDVRHSWTTEKEPVQERLGGGIDLTSFRFRNHHHQHDEEEEREEEEEEEEHDSESSYASLEWVTRQLRELERQTLPEDSAPDEHITEEIDTNVKEALSLLNQGQATSQSNEQDETWATSAKNRRDSYFDIVQEAMAAEWHGQEEYEQDGQSNSDHDHQEEQDEYQTPVQEEPEVADEWLEAFTAKGRVYYYNRRTRESSWTRPESLANTFEVEGGQHNEQEQEEEKKDNEDDHYQEKEGNDDDHDEQQEDVKQQQNESIEHHERQQQSDDTQTGEHSAPSSVASSTHGVDKEPFTPPTESSADALYCCFCGTQVAGASGFQSHFATCATLQHHKETASSLYTQFQQMLVLLSEDTSLRSLHYASSFPDAKPHPVGDEPPEQTQQSVRESLALLRVKHRSSRRPSVHHVPEYEERIPSLPPAPRLSLSSSNASRKRFKEPREPLSSRYSSMKQKPTPVALLNMETCRHCGRSFAEGRLAKHEAVCPRVFGNEHAWGRGPSPSVQKTSTPSDPPSQRQDQMLRTLKKKHYGNLTNTLALSFQEHQASLVECPCCRRKFAPSGAQQHIDICKTVQHRPRNPVPLLKDYAIAG